MHRPCVRKAVVLESEWWCNERHTVYKGRGSGLNPDAHSTKAMLNSLSRRKFNIEYLVVQRYFQQPTVNVGFMGL